MTTKVFGVAINDLPPEASTISFVTTLGNQFEFVFPSGDTLADRISSAPVGELESVKYNVKERASLVVVSGAAIFTIGYIGETPTVVKPAALTEETWSYLGSVGSMYPSYDTQYHPYLWNNSQTLSADALSPGVAVV